MKKWLLDLISGSESFIFFIFDVLEAEPGGQLAGVRRRNGDESSANSEEAREYPE